MEIKFDAQDMAEVRKLFNSSDVLYNRVAYRAMAKVVAGVKTDTDAEIRDIYNLTKGKVSPGIHTTKGSMTAPGFSVTVGKHGADSSRPISLINFGARQTQKGVSTQVLKAATRKVTPHLFIANGRNNNRHVFVREYRWKGKGPYMPGSKKLPYGGFPSKFSGPVLKRTGPRLADAFAGRPNIYINIKTKGVTRIKKEVGYQMDMALKSL